MPAGTNISHTAIALVFILRQVIQFSFFVHLVLSKSMVLWMVMAISVAFNDGDESYGVPWRSVFAFILIMQVAESVWLVVLEIDVRPIQCFGSQWNVRL